MKKENVPTTPQYCRYCGNASLCAEEIIYKADFVPTTMKGMPGVCKHRPKNRMERMRANRKNKEQTK